MSVRAAPPKDARKRNCQCVGCSQTLFFSGEISSIGGTVHYVRTISTCNDLMNFEILFEHRHSPPMAHSGLGRSASGGRQRNREQTGEGAARDQLAPGSARSMENPTLYGFGCPALSISSHSIPPVNHLDLGGCPLETTMISGESGGGGW